MRMRHYRTPLKTIPLKTDYCCSQKKQINSNYLLETKRLSTGLRHGCSLPQTEMKVVGQKRRFKGIAHPKMETHLLTIKMFQTLSNVFVQLLTVINYTGLEQPLGEQNYSFNFN